MVASSCRYLALPDRTGWFMKSGSQSLKSLGDLISSIFAFTLAVNLTPIIELNAPYAILDLIFQSICYPYTHTLNRPLNVLLSLTVQAVKTSSFIKRKTLRSTKDSDSQLSEFSSEAQTNQSLELK